MRRPDISSYPGQQFSAYEKRLTTSPEPINGDSPHSEYLSLTPGPPNRTQVIIQADPGTAFEDCFGMSYVGFFLTEFDNVVQSD